MIYKLDTDIDKFQTLELDSVSLAYQLFDQLPKDIDVGGFDGLIERLFKQPLTNSSLFEVWGNVTANMGTPFVKQTRKPDISVWIFSYLLLSKKAFDVFKGLLADVGELLPLTVDGEEMYIFNSMSFCQEDLQKCTTDSHGIYNYIEFEEVNAKNKPLFKSKLLSGTGIYASEEFRELYLESNLSGLTFSTELCSGGID